MEHGTILQYSQNFPRADRVALALDVAQGLDYLHSRTPRILHLNLSPDNILVGDTGRAVIASFASSREMCSDQPHDMDEDDFLSTCRYLAPETFTDSTSISGETDVFAWAMCTLHIVSGVAPFPGKSDVFAAIHYHQGRRPRKEDHPSKKMKKEVWELLEHCWKHMPLARPSMSEVVRQLQGIRDKLAAAELDDQSQENDLEVTLGPSVWQLLQMARKWRSRVMQSRPGNP